MMGLGFLKEVFDTLPYVIKGRTPGQLIIQTTDICNATCPQCGMRAQEKFERSKLDIKSMMKMIDRAAENNVKALSFTGGEPFLYEDDLFTCINYACIKGIPYIRTGTNGFMFKDCNKAGYEEKIRSFARRMKSSGLYTFWISLDSWDADVHERNRGLKGVVEGMRKALPLFKEEGLYPSVNLGINRTIVQDDLSINEGSSCAEKDAFYNAYVDGFRKFYSFVHDMGFTIANACYPMSMQEGAVYKAESSDYIVSYNRTEKYYMFRAMYDVIPEFRHKLRIFTPRSSLLMMIREYADDDRKAFPCYGGVDYFFVDSRNGHAYPCGFRSEDDLGAYELLDTKGIDCEPYCDMCDWECFRDPSNQLGAVSNFFRNPLKTALRYFSDRELVVEWWKDLFYYFSCGMFNFKKSPSYRIMNLFKKKRVGDKKCEEVLASGG